MDESTYIKLIVAQITSLRLAAGEALGEDSPAVTALDEAIVALRAVNRPVPAGFADAAAYNTFLADQVNQVFEGQDVAVVAESVADVVGIVQQADGTLLEVGNLDEAVARANALVEPYVDEDGEVDEVPETDNLITVTYTRVDGEALSDDNVRTIINHPVSAPLRHLGNIQLLEIGAGEDRASRRAVFAVLEDGAINLRTLAMGAVSYRGVQVFPGLGRVQAIGAVNFA